MRRTVSTRSTMYITFARRPSEGRAYTVSLRSLARFSIAVRRASGTQLMRTTESGSCGRTARRGTRSQATWLAPHGCSRQTRHPGVPHNGGGGRRHDPPHTRARTATTTTTHLVGAAHHTAHIAAHGHVGGIRGLTDLAEPFNALRGGGHVGVTKTDDGLGALNTEEMNAPRVKPMVH